MGEKSSARLWNDFAAESPGQARIVIADVNADKAAAVQATKDVDKVLTKSESKVKVKKSAKEPKTVLTAKTDKQFLRAMLDSSDPFEREQARRELGLA